VTAKEKLLERAPHWSEEQAERALRGAEGDETIDERGELSNLHEANTAESMRRLADEERAAGHKHCAGTEHGLGPSWDVSRLPQIRAVDDWELEALSAMDREDQYWLAV
jgi:hypothetical protein